MPRMASGFLGLFFHIVECREDGEVDQSFMTFWDEHGRIIWTDEY